MDQYVLYDQSYDKEKGWNPIRTFRGNFDGGHHVIRNLYINRPEEDYVGFFGYLYGNIESSPLSDVRDGTRGLVQNLGLEEAEVTPAKAATRRAGGRNDLRAGFPLLQHRQGFRRRQIPNHEL